MDEDSKPPGKQSHYEVSEGDRKLHNDLTAEIRKRQLSSAENFDKSVLTLSSGGLAFSLGFLKDFVPISKAIWASALYISWGALTLATCSTMISFLVSMKAQDFQQARADAYYLGGDDSAFTRPNPWDQITTWLNRISGVCFLAGVVLTTIFVAINLTQAQKMTNSNRSTNDGLSAPQLMQKNSGSADLQKGLPAPTMTAKVPVQPASAPAPATPSSTPTPTGQSTKK